MPLRYREGGIRRTALDDTGNQTIFGAVDFQDSVDYQGDVENVGGLSSLKETGIPYLVDFETPLFAWGSNGNGRLGLDDVTNRHIPTQVDSTIWKQVSGGNAHTLAIRETDGVLFAWGSNSAGQLGLGNTTNRHIPTCVGSTSWSQVSGGSNHSLAIRATDGVLFAWGSNSAGHLGLDDTTDRHIPTQVGSTCWSQISAAGDHTLAIRATDGRLFAWGWNSAGQLGLGDAGSGTTRHIPTQVGSTSWSQVSAGSFHTLAIRETDGVLFAWGSNFSGQLGLGDAGSGTNRHIPTQVGSTIWSQVSGGDSHSLGIAAIPNAAEDENPIIDEPTEDHVIYIKRIF